MLDIPKLKKFIFPLIGTLTIFQLSLQQSMPIHTLNKLLQSHSNSKQAHETLILQNGIYIFGCVLGSETYKYHHQPQALDYQQISLANLFFSYQTNCTVLLLSITTMDNQPIEAYLILRVFVGIANGLNYAQSIIYVKQMSSKKESQFFFKLIPLQLLIGQFLGAFWLEHSNQFATFQQFLNVVLILNSVSVLRMILLQFLQIETPQYYLQILKDSRRSKMIYQEIHNDNIQTYFGFEQETLRNNIHQNTSEYLISKPYLKKYFKCCLLIVLTQFTGETLIFSFLYSPLTKSYQDVDNVWIYAFVTGISLVVLQMVFYNFIKRKKIITLIGQAIICIALAFLGFSNSLWALILLQFGYSLGIGTQIFSIIPYQLPEFGILYCINIQWIIGLIEMCFYGLFLNKLPSSDSLEQVHALQELIQIYFFVSCVGLILIFIILRQPIRTQPQQKIKKEEKKSI
ncbi:unnamed protein product (macronuclear) [Paramecium tetraurelia]|uniref:Major facilitator superfamily (MFS) profile domain-containing protein n=1 Tax=Paramecium tetraurelia TaxID=5888 RepID=A0CNT5_PARTE|nr:uncharacterized protein GSPATT00008894001 [Paramecium tetraurelia]CAK72452.1 unnamed protein product [Paramecium tetraurelia]|eukprot:XP_001439849.1 hypothetical protein (macronuclear) [Paramecium tetraurelia strain d4-2]